MRIAGRPAPLFSHLTPTAATPAKAGAQLGDIANGALPFVIATLPIGPRPPPGWFGSCGGK